jgi:2-desacetyl-2-hydroxyethyl bacteriochlorophyllide A dehydrogenase
MRALVFHGKGDLRLETLPLPEPGPGEVRLRPLAAGICGTDAHILHGEFPAPAPVVLGHEVAGVVDAVGAGVKHVREGDLATLQPNTFCGLCRYCRTGREHLCPSMRAYGVHWNGGFAEAMVPRTGAIYRLPPETSPRAGCLAEPLACAIHGMDRLAVASGSTVLVLGAGLLGLMLIRLARLAGAGLVAVSEPHEARRADAATFGADAAVDPAVDGWRERLLAATSGEGFDHVIDAAGSAATLEAGVSLAARGGRILVFGVAPPGEVAQVRPNEVFSRELTIVGSLVNPYTHERAVNLLPHMMLDHLRLATFPLARFGEAFEAQASGATATKVLLLPQP